MIRAKNIQVGQVFKAIHSIYGGFQGVFVMTFVDHDRDHCYVTYKRLWLWHSDACLTGIQTHDGMPWECDWPYELII